MRILNKFISTETGRILLSILLGLGLSAIFKKSCDSKNCFILESPPLDELRETTYKHNDKCYKYYDLIFTI